MHHPNQPVSRDEQIARLYETHSSELLRALGRVVRTDRPVIEDACSFAWTQLLTHHGVSLDDARVGGWLLRVAQREAWRLDAQRRRTGGPIPDTIPDPTSHERQRHHIHAAHAIQCVKALPPRQARMVLLQLAGHSHRDIAHITGDTQRTVERQLLRATATLRASAAQDR